MTDGEYDYIIVGGGSSGCVVASRLSEDPNVRVLLLEEGPTDKIFYVRAPAGFFKLLGSKRSQVYATESQPNARGRTLYVPQGRVLGGGSSINAMAYIRGDRADYDGWRDNGCPGWGWDDMLPYFKKQEANQRLSTPLHGTTGPIKVSDPPSHHTFSDAVVRAAQEIGIPYSGDFNGTSQLGTGFYQATMGGGERSSSASGYLWPALQRSKNLTLRLNSQVTRVIFNGRRATGVNVRAEGGGEITLSAKRGVVVTAGALATPKILMLSGVGPAAHLAKMGIPLVYDAPDVGGNFHDHLMVPTFAQTKQPISYAGEEKGLRAIRNYLQWRLFRTGPLTSNGAECGGFVDTNGDGRADLQLICSPLLMGDVDRAPLPGHGITLNAQYLRPKSRGMVRLRSPNDHDPIMFHANYLSEQQDVDTLVSGVKLARKLLRAPSLAAIVSAELKPGPQDNISDSAIEDHVRTYAMTVYHPVGTCRMGSDDRSVVTPELAVRGLENFYIGDSSVMPSIPSGNTNATTVVIGERCAEFIMNSRA